jgi:hypothetical protein
MMRKYSKSPATTNPTYPQFVVSPLPQQYCTNVQKVHHNVCTSSTTMFVLAPVDSQTGGALCSIRLQTRVSALGRSILILHLSVLHTESWGRSFTWESSWLVGHEGAEEIGTHNNQSSTHPFNGAQKGIRPQNNQPFTHPLLCPIALIAHRGCDCDALTQCILLRLAARWSPDFA